jgi:hypothetical protein
MGCNNTPTENKTEARAAAALQFVGVELDHFIENPLDIRLTVSQWIGQ